MLALPKQIKNLIEKCQPRPGVHFHLSSWVHQWHMYSYIFIILLQISDSQHLEKKGLRGPRYTDAWGKQYSDQQYGAGTSAGASATERDQQTDRFRT